MSGIASVVVGILGLTGTASGQATERVSVDSTGLQGNGAALYPSVSAHGAIGAFEATPLAMAREVFETNTFGVMAMTQAVLPQFRARRAGVIVNVTSSVTLTAMPLVAVYTASKMAIEGFTASLELELADLGVRVKLVEPGYAPTTRFTSNGGSRMEGLFPEAYAAFTKPILASLAQVTTVTTESDVAEAVYRAANDASGQLRFPAGADAVALSPPVGPRWR